MALKHKIARLRRLKQQLIELEREIQAEGSALLRAQGCLINPRIERIMEQFGQ